MSETLDNLVRPRILMSRNKPKAVLVPDEMFKAMEIAIEDKFDGDLLLLASQRVGDSNASYISHDDFWNDLGSE
ncbi:MAG: hypothetical protein PHI41_10695 [Erysipelotrichaceae bacterium]|nr:hypothetical protein [Erysipelotrichaceae bacterium]